MDYETLMRIVKQRRSCRSFDPEKGVQDSDIRKCLEAARLAPSSCNKQPWRFIVVKSPEKRSEICGKAILPGITLPWLKEAPVIIVLAAKPEIATHCFAPILSGIQYHLIDLGIAGEHFNLAAESLGLSACWIGWFKPKAVKKLLSIPFGVEPAALIALGYPKERPEGVSKRLALEEIACSEVWGNPLP